MATFSPNEIYPIATAAEFIGVSEAFLLNIVAKGVKAGVIQPVKHYSIRGSDLSRLGKVFAHQFESEQHRQAYLRVQKRDDDELRERLERGA